MDSFHSDNIYLCLELFVDPAETDRNKLLGILDDKKREWNRMRNRPDGLFYQSLVERCPYFKEVIETEDLRRLASEAKNVRLAELDRYISNVAGSTITEKQIDAIVLKFAPFFAEETVRGRIAVPVGEASEIAPPPPPKPSEDSSLPKFASLQLSKTAQLLRTLGCRTIYDALGVPRSSSLTSLRSAADRLLEEARKATVKSAAISVKGEIGGLAKQFFLTGKHRDGFNRSWARYRVECELEGIFSTRCVEKTISYEELYERSVREATEKGMTLEEAEWFVYRFYVERRKCPDPRTAVAVPLPAKIQCPECSHLNEESANNCRQCGCKLRVSCPKCGAENVGAIYCVQCGFAFGDVELGARKLSEFKDAAAKGDFARALEIFRESQRYWDLVPESKGAFAEFRDQYARVRFDEARAEFRAGRLDVAKRIAESLSFDGRETLKTNEYRADLERIFESARLVAETIREIESLKAQSLYFTAFERWRDLEANALVEKDALDDAKTQRIKNGLVEILADVNVEFEVALSTGDVADKEGMLDLLTRRFPDFEDAKKALNDLPPAAPNRVEAKGTGNGIEISWERSRSIGEIHYRIFRSSLDVAGGSVDKILLAETDDASFVDADAEEFVAYDYSVHSVRGGVRSDGATSRPVLRVGRVRDVKIDAKDATVEFRWFAPSSPRVLEIVVERTQRGDSAPTAIESVDAKGFYDFGLSNDVEYNYAVALRYRDADGAERLSSQESFSAKPVATPSGILDLECRFDADARTIEATWTPPPQGETFFLISRRQASPLAQYQGDLAALERTLDATAQRPRDGESSESSAKRVAVLQANPSDLVQFVWPATRLNEQIAVGRSVRVFTGENQRISNVRTQQIDQTVYVSWDWSAGLERVAIFFDYFLDGDAPGPGDGRSKKIILTQKEYEREGAWLAPACGRAQIFPCFVDDGQETLGKGTAIGLQKEFVEYRRLETSSKTKRFSLWRNRRESRGATDKSLIRVQFQLRATRDGALRTKKPEIPEILVVAKRGGPPLHRNDGVSVKRIPAALASENVCELPRQDGFYYRCYLANVEDRTRFVLLDPLERELELFPRGEPFQGKKKK